MSPIAESLSARQTSSLKTVMMFPGQGSQHVGMGKSLWENNTIADEVFSRADEVLGWSVRELCANGPEARLTRTEFLQPAMFVLSVAIFDSYMGAGGQEPLAAMGHSLGEYAALVAAGALTFESALRVVAQRGSLMATAVPDGTGGMGAVIGLHESDVQRVCEQLLDDLPKGMVLEVANINCPGQVVVSGHVDAIDAARIPMRQAGAKGLIPLKVSAPFHCELMRPAALGLSEALSDVKIFEPRFPVLSCVTARPHQGPDSIRRLLVQQLVKPVRWTGCIQWALGLGGETFLEMGPGKVLAGLLRRIKPAAKTIGVADNDGIGAVFEHLDGEIS